MNIIRWHSCVCDNYAKGVLSESSPIALTMMALFEDRKIVRYSWFVDSMLLPIEDLEHVSLIICWYRCRLIKPTRSPCRRDHIWNNISYIVRLWCSVWLSSLEDVTDFLTAEDWMQRNTDFITKILKLSPYENMIMGRVSLFSSIASLGTLSATILVMNWLLVASVSFER